MTFIWPVSIIFANCFWMSSTCAMRFSVSARCARSVASSSFDAFRFVESCESWLSSCFFAAASLTRSPSQSVARFVASSPILVLSVTMAALLPRFSRHESRSSTASLAWVRY